MGWRALTSWSGSDVNAAGVDRDPHLIAAMFGRIVPCYDLMNSLMTAGLDRRWRRLAADEAWLSPGDRALDVCCGTGELAFALADRWPGVSVTGLDFTPEMLVRARQKADARDSAAGPASGRARSDDVAARAALRQPEFAQGDVLALPFAGGEFAAVTAGWGVRNVPDLPRALAEMTRVTRPGGRVVCLESTRPPRGPGRWFHTIWFERVVPMLGRFVSGEGSAYEYLPASVRDFPDADGLAALMSQTGLVRVRYRRLGLGAVALHVGEVPQDAGR